jgi:hypothetical protein
MVAVTSQFRLKLLLELQTTLFSTLLALLVFLEHFCCFLLLMFPFQKQRLCLSNSIATAFNFLIRLLDSQLGDVLATSLAFSIKASSTLSNFSFGYIAAQNGLPLPPTAKEETSAAAASVAAAVPIAGPSMVSVATPEE